MKILDFKKNNLNHEKEHQLWDAVIIGGGLAGATICNKLSEHNFKILVIEHGMHIRREDYENEKYTKKNINLMKPLERVDKGYYPNEIKITINKKTFKYLPTLGFGLGGTSNLYGAQLERMKEIDFEYNEKYYYNLENDGVTKYKWPIKYEEFTEFYKKAEDMFRVAGTYDILFEKKENIKLRFVPKYNFKYRILYRNLKKLKLHPYKSHVAFDHIKNCNECGGVLCVYNCKNDAYKICIKPLLDFERITFLTEYEAVKILVKNNLCSQVEIVSLIDGKKIKINTRLVISAAGALFTPKILLNSSDILQYPNGLSNSSGLVGKNLMFHTNILFLILDKNFIFNNLFNNSKKKIINNFNKTISFNDFYIYQNKKYGTIQTIGVPIDSQQINSYLISNYSFIRKIVKINLILKLINIMCAIIEIISKNFILMSVIIEDLPFASNKVSINKNEKSGIEIEYNINPDLFLRNIKIKKHIKENLKKSFFVFFLNKKININYSHACGTCKMGENKNDSVVNFKNQSHDLNNLFIVDSSFFPSSSGVNPSLTIIANAIRVSKFISEYLNK